MAATTYIPVAETAGDDEKGEVEACSVDYDESSDNSGPRLETSKGKFIFLIIAILISNFSTAVDSSLSASTHVAVASTFNSTNLSTLPVNAFLITTLTFQPLYAPLSDHLGRRLPYLLGSGLFLLGLICSAIATSWTGLIAARALCGCGVAGVSTMGSVVLTDAVGVARRGYYQSMNYVIYGSGSAIGSGVGGAIVQRLGWDWVYKIQIPMATLALFLIAMTVPSPSWLGSDKEKPFGWSRYFEPFRVLQDFDWRGSILLMLSLCSLFGFLVSGGNSLPWTSPIVVAAGICFLVFSALFIRTEQRVLKPVLPLNLLFKFPTRNLIVTGFLYSVINQTTIYNTTLFFQTVLLDTPELASSHLVISSISFTLSSALTGTLIARFKTPRPTLRASQYLLAAGTFGLLLMATIFPTLKLNSPWIYNMTLILPAAGTGMMAPSVILALLKVADSEDHAIAVSSLIMMRNLGVFVATALSSTTIQNTIQLSYAAYHYNPATKIEIENTRHNIELLATLNEPYRSQVMTVYAHAFSVIFGFCFVLSSVIVFTLSRVKVEAFREEDKSDEEDGS